MMVTKCVFMEKDGQLPLNYPCYLWSTGATSSGSTLYADLFLNSLNKHFMKFSRHKFYLLSALRCFIGKYWNCSKLTFIVQGLDFI